MDVSIFAYEDKTVDFSCIPEDKSGYCFISVRSGESTCNTCFIRTKENFIAFQQLSAAVERLRKHLYAPETDKEADNVQQSG